MKTCPVLLYLALVRATLRRLGSFRNPIPWCSLALTQDRMIKSFSRPWKASTLAISTSWSRGKHVNHGSTVQNSCVTNRHYETHWPALAAPIIWQKCYFCHDERFGNSTELKENRQSQFRTNDFYVHCFVVLFPQHWHRSMESVPFLGMRPKKLLSIPKPRSKRGPNQCCCSQLPRNLDQRDTSLLAEVKAFPPTLPTVRTSSKFSILQNWPYQTYNCLVCSNKY